jgi:nicotinamide-nucleotide amidase
MIMTVELISVGTELLLGDIINTNAAYLSRQCAALGLSCYYQTVVGDNATRLTATLRTAISRSDIILLTGGLGPTQDDLTKEVVAQVAGQPLLMDPKSREMIEDYFTSRGMTPTQNNWKQALVPQGATVLYNDHGTAPGLIVVTQNTRLILLPGPPHEMRLMFEKNVLPYLRSLEAGVIHSTTVKLYGIGESAAEAKILDLIESQTNPTIATYAKTGEVQVRVSAKAANLEDAQSLIQPTVTALCERFGSLVYSTKETQSLEEAVIEQLQRQELTITAAESCTGGLFLSSLTHISGASRIFEEGFVTYSNEAKQQLLSVKESDLQTYGAVSETVCREMALGALAWAGADVGVAITGIAGPDGGSEEKPVGTVWICAATADKQLCRHHLFAGDRGQIRERSVHAAWGLLRELLCSLDQNTNHYIYEEDKTHDNTTCT